MGRTTRLHIQVINDTRNRIIFVFQPNFTNFDPDVVFIFSGIDGRRGWGGAERCGRTFVAVDL
jgi:hypothetical protein